MPENIYMLSDAEIAKKIGEKFRHLRLLQNETQKRISEESQISLSTVKKIEKGEISSFDSFIRMLRVLGKLDVFSTLIQEEMISPSEYFRLTQEIKKKERKRASASKNKTPQSTITESEW